MSYKTCKDCGMTIDQFVTKKEQICKSCYIRKTNAKHRGITYIRFLDLSEKEQKSIIKRREMAQKRKENEKKDNIVHTKGKNNAVLDYESQKDIVMKDIETSLKNNNLDMIKNIKNLKNNSLCPIFEQLNVLLSDDYKKYIMKLKVIEDILNKTELDYKHAKEYYSSLVKENYTEANNYRKRIWEIRHEILLEYRRGIKNIINEFDSAGVFFISLKNNKDLMKEFDDCYKKLQYTHSISENKVYKAEVSNLVNEEDFCIGFKNNKLNKAKYNVIITTLYNGSVSHFNRSVFANDEIDAKNQVIQFIEERRDQFKFTWKDKDIVVTRIQN